MRDDAKRLKGKGAFRPDGLSNYAKGNSDQQGFTPSTDRQTFRGVGNGSQQSWYVADLGDYETRLEFDELLGGVRRQLAAGLDRPSLLGNRGDGTTPRRDEITYNWYEPGARLGRHLDEHHDETKGPKGWRYPTRRSVTWLVYLNDDWQEREGGALLCHPRRGDVAGGGPVGAHEGNLQVGWMRGDTPVYLDAFRDSGRTALYSCREGDGDGGRGRVYWSEDDFDVPAQPIDFRAFLPGSARAHFEQISTASKDPRFVATSGAAAASSASAARDGGEQGEGLVVLPSGGKLVLFDSVTLPHSVLEVTGDRQRIAATGWFHEESQFFFEDVA